MIVWVLGEYLLSACILVRTTPAPLKSTNSHPASNQKAPTSNFKGPPAHPPSHPPSSGLQVLQAKLNRNLNLRPLEPYSIRPEPYVLNPAHARVRKQAATIFRAPYSEDPSMLTSMLQYRTPNSRILLKKPLNRIT